VPTVELLMCPACGHPQAFSAQCVACGVPLPPPVSATGPGPGAANTASVQEVSLTLAGRTLTLHGDRLTVEGGGTAHRVPLSQVQAVQLSSRRPLEALAPGALFALALVLGHNPGLRWLFAALLVLSLIAIPSYRRHRVRILTGSTHPARLSLGTLARRGSSDDRRLEAGLEQLATGLAARGVEVQR